jgi:hypothetical protein
MLSDSPAAAAPAVRAARPASAAARTAAASIPQTGMFNIHAASNPWLPDPFSLASTTVLQSFAFDNVHRHLYTVQLTVNGTLGELTCTKMDYTGTEIEPNWLHLKGFGHGVQIGVQPDGGSAYVWVETLADGTTYDGTKVTVPNGSTSGFGTQIARFKFDDFAHGATLSPGTSGVEIYKPRPTYGCKSIAIDNSYGYASLRYKLDGPTARFDLYDLDSFAAHKYTALATVTLDDTSGYPTQDSPTFQGHTTYGSYLYLLTGTHDTNNMTIWAIDWLTGKFVDSFVTEAGKSLSWREPEGMAVWEAGDGSEHLSFGIATGATGDRKAAIFYK